MLNLLLRLLERLDLHNQLLLYIIQRIRAEDEDNDGTDNNKNVDQDTSPLFSSYEESLSWIITYVRIVLRMV